MKTVFIDVRWGIMAPGEAEPDPATGWVRHSGPRDYPSPGLLSAARAAEVRGEEVVFRHVAVDSLDALDDAVDGCDRVVLCAPGPHAERIEAVTRSLAGREVTILDPSAAVASEPGYSLCDESVVGHAEVDCSPYRVPVHPWSSPPLVGEVGDWEARIAAAAASFTPRDPEVLARPVWQAWERDLFLNDHRIPTDMDRLRGAARLISKSLKEHSTMLKLHLRVWPKDMLEHPRVPDHLTLLNIGSVDVMVGTTLGGSDLPGACSTADVEAALTALSNAGMSHLCSVSIVLGLPGQTAEADIVATKHALKLCLQSKIRRLRISFWLGETPVCPRSPEHQHALFMASHPNWHELEYRGLFDFIAVLRGAVGSVSLIGPAHVPQWESGAPA